MRHGWGRWRRESGVREGGREGGRERGGMDGGDGGERVE